MERADSRVELEPCPWRDAICSRPWPWAFWGRAGVIFSSLRLSLRRQPLAPYLLL